MVKLTNDGPRACKHVLPVPPDVIAGYQHLHTNEEIFNRKAIEAMPEAVASWYGYLAIFVTILKPDHECPDQEDEQACTARMLRLHFAIAACGTSKIVLDLGLAGYYAQAYALMRHMFETWLQMVFLRLDPSVALAWMGTSGDQHCHEPSYGRVLKGVKKWTKHEGDKVNLATVESKINQLNKGAHPSRILVEQIRGDQPGVVWLASNLGLDRLTEAMDIGTIATALLLHEAGRLFELKDDFWARFEQLHQERVAWRQAASLPGSDLEAISQVCRPT